MGVTGQGADEFHDGMREYLSHVKSISKIPVMMGFGIKTAKDVEPFKDIIDGCIVGSHFIKIMKESNYDISAIKEYITIFKKDFNI